MGLDARLLYRYTENLNFHAVIRYTKNIFFYF